MIPKRKSRFLGAYFLAVMHKGHHFLATLQHQTEVSCLGIIEAGLRSAIRRAARAPCALMRRSRVANDYRVYYHK